MGSIFGKETQPGNYNAMTGDPDFIATDLQSTLNVTREEVLRVYDRYIR